MPSTAPVLAPTGVIVKRMLFNATQAEELRVAIVDGQKLLDFDIESAAREQRKGNIYKATITRLENSLEACFMDYGGKRHGFLPFKEISRESLSVRDDSKSISSLVHENQELVVQIEKDERGQKGASMTTFISLAGRFLVLMPTNASGGGVSRRINTDERDALRDLLSQLQIPEGMSVIARTAAIGRSVEDLQWDLNYLLHLWQAISDGSKRRSGHFLIYHDSSLVIRAIRDYFHPDIAEILVDTEEVFQQAQKFMLSVMPEHVDRIKLYHDDVPLFSRFQIEHQIESAYGREVVLPSGGAIVIDHTEALVSIDVNSRRSTRGADIEETALRTNLEAAEEIARQLRLRDLGGLIVIDFIDMESGKSKRDVESRLRECLRPDRARIHMEHISQLGLLELSRQCLRPALVDESYITCPRCSGTGRIRSTESSALNLLRLLEEEAMKENTGTIQALVPLPVASYLLNEKRFDVQALEVRHKVSLMVIPHAAYSVPMHKISRLRHDQLDREDNQRSSYEIQEQAERQAQDAEVKEKNATIEPKMEAAVKLSSMAPVPLPPTPRPAALSVAVLPKKMGLFARLAAWLSGSETTNNSNGTNSATSVHKNAPREGRSGRDYRRRGGRGHSNSATRNNAVRRAEEGGNRNDRNHNRRRNRRHSRTPREEGARSDENSQNS